jgi:uncharacterized protein
MNTLMKSLYASVVLLLFISSTGFSQNSASHSSVALELLEMMNMEKTLTQGVDIALSAQLKANPSLKPYEDILRNFMSKYMNWPNLKDRFVELYVNEFSEDELRELIVFYKTDIGKKAIEKLPLLYAKGSELGQQVVQEHMAELTDAIQSRAKELNKKE